MKGGTTNMEPTLQVFTEVFPIPSAALPTLSAYQLYIRGTNGATIGGKLAYRLAKVCGGHWVWAEQRLITDTPQEEAVLMRIVEALWSEQPGIFKDLQKLTLDPSWQPTPLAKAKFVANGLAGEVEPEIRRFLSTQGADLGAARIERIAERRAWVVQGQPALSLSISSSLFHKQSLKTYCTLHAAAPEEVIGLMVADKLGTLKGEIISVVGTVREYRKQLLSLTKRKEMQEVIEKAPEDEWVVEVSTGRDVYDYVLSALRIVVRMQDLHRFQVDAKRATSALRLPPARRAELVREASAPLKDQGLIQRAYSSQGVPAAFLNVDGLSFHPSLRFGGNQVHPYDQGTLLQHLRTHGVYKRAAAFADGTPIRIGLINTLGATVTLDAFRILLQGELKALQFAVLFLPEVQTSGTSRAALEEVIDQLQETAHVLVAFLPDEADDDEEKGSYNDFKSLTVGRGIPSQVVNRSTLAELKYAIGNIALGIIGKTGNVPFILDQGLEGVDLIVGIDIARQRKARLAGSINATAIARIYFGSGEFVRYVIHDAPLEGETIPANVLQGLFPRKEFAGKRVVIHRDGPFRGAEKQILKTWAEQIGATFYFVEILKSGAPRLYGIQNRQTQQPPKGSVFQVSESQALLVSSLPPFPNATPQPLQIQTEAPFTIGQAIHSVLSLTLLHYGSLRPPRLPVTIHYSDKIAYMALRGIKPKDLEGATPFWL
jgi:hypothetical protein